MEMRQIRYFLAVEETGTFTKAAEKVFVSQPALSAGVKALEEQLGVQLLVRGKKRVSLTPEGLRFREHARLIVEEFAAARQELKHIGKSNDLRIGVFSAFTITSFASLLRDFKKRCKNADLIRLYGGNTVEVARMLGRGKVDLILTALTANDNQETSLPLFEEDYVLTISEDHPLARKNRIFLKDLHKEAMIQRSNCESFREAFQQFQEKGCEPEIICNTDQDNWALRLVQSSDWLKLSKDIGRHCSNCRLSRQNARDFQ